MRLTAGVLLIVLALAPLGCKRRQAGSSAPGAPELASTVHLGDPRVADQLVSGFYQIEANAWRWSARKFAVLLRAPAGSGQVGAALAVHVTVPPVLIEKLSSVTLSATIDGTTLGPETWTRPGEYVYQRDVPANLIRGPAVRVEFEVAKTMTPGSVDQRELGIVVSSVGLALK